jgi:hypothetical protein
MRFRTEIYRSPPRRFAFRDAAATLASLGRYPAWMRRTWRVALSSVERYAVFHADVLVQGGDPYLGLLSAITAATAGRRVLIDMSSRMTLPDDLRDVNLHRLLHLPFQDSVRSDPVVYLNSLCDSARLLFDVHGKPLIRVNAGPELQPDSGASTNYHDSHIFWPLPPSAPSLAQSADVRVYKSFLERRLPLLGFRQQAMSLEYVRVSSLVLTSPVPGYDDVTLRCSVDRVGAAWRPLGYGQGSDRPLREQDFGDVTGLAF